MFKGYSLIIGALFYALPALAASGSDFVTEAIKGDNSEIMLGRYAAEHAASPKIKEFGRMLVADHTKAKRQMSSLAGKVGAKAPSGATLEADAERVKLIALGGKNFDHEFAQYMIRDHESDIAKFKEEAAANDGPVSAMAKKQLPVLEKHLAMARSVGQI
jgi:putative membrane protein